MFFRIIYQNKKSLIRNLATISTNNSKNIHNEKDLDNYIKKLNSEITKLNSLVLKKHKLVNEAKLRKDLKIFNYDQDVSLLMQIY